MNKDTSEVIYAKPHPTYDDVMMAGTFKMDGDTKYILAKNSISKAEHDKVVKLMSEHNLERINELKAEHEAQLAELEKRLIDAISDNLTTLSHVGVQTTALVDWVEVDDVYELIEQTFKDLL